MIENVNPELLASLREAFALTTRENLSNWIPK